MEIDIDPHVVLIYDHVEDDYVYAEVVDYVYEVEDDDYEAER